MPTPLLRRPGLPCGGEHLPGPGRDVGVGGSRLGGRPAADSDRRAGAPRDSVRRQSRLRLLALPRARGDGGARVSAFRSELIKATSYGPRKQGLIESAAGVAREAGAAVLGPIEVKTVVGEGELEEGLEVLIKAADAGAGCAWRCGVSSPRCRRGAGCESMSTLDEHSSETSTRRKGHRRSMAVLTIRTFGDPVLRHKTHAVAEVGDVHRRLSEDMLETMREAPGVGLAGTPGRRPRADLHLGGGR